MKTAKEMYEFCKRRKFAQGQSEKWALKHFGLIEENLSSDEDVLMCFIGLHNYISPTRHNNNFAYAITEKRIIVAQKRIIGEELQTIFVENINDILFSMGMAVGVITIDTIKEKFNVALDKSGAANINSEIHDLLYSIRQGSMSAKSSKPKEDYDAAQELRKYKELLDDGIITQEDFDAKKKHLLNL